MVEIKRRFGRFILRKNTKIFIFVEVWPKKFREKLRRMNPSRIRQRLPTCRSRCRPTPISGW